MNNRMAELIPPPNQKTTDLPRWACPRCHGTDVQVLLPAWHYETRGHHLTTVQTDEGAAVMAWYCEDCVESDSGRPIDLLEGKS